MAMLQHIEEQAEVCIARGCGFAALAVLTLIVGLSWDVALASKVGGLLVLAACLILIIKAYRALDCPVQATELWMTLEPDVRPAARIAQQIIGPMLRTCYLQFALRAADLSACLLMLSLGLRILAPAPHEIAGAAAADF